jgi:RNA exonuclease 4
MMSTNQQSKKEQNQKKEEVFLSIDVECVATGCGHLDRTPVSVTVVNESEVVLVDKKIKPPHVHSYLTEMTGFTKDQLQDERNFEEVMQEVRTHLGPHVVLVGQGIENDIRWLQVGMLIIVIIHFYLLFLFF